VSDLNRSSDPEGLIHHGLEGVHPFEHTGEKEYQVLSGCNLGSPTLVMCLPLQEFYDRSFVANSDNLSSIENLKEEPIAQRPLDPRHSFKLAVYILKGLFPSVESYYRARLGREPSPAFYRLWESLGRAPYQSLQPITANLRSCIPGGRDLKFRRFPDGRITVFLSPAHTLWVLDGQHRREAMALVGQFLKEIQRTRRYPTVPALHPEMPPGSEVSEEDYDLWGEILGFGFAAATVVVEVHLGLDSHQQRQLFHDLNNLVKRVDTNLAYDFDRANPINLYIKENLVEHGILKARIVDSEPIGRDWEKQPGTFKRKDIIAVCAILFLGKHNVTGASPGAVARLEHYADQFWKLVGAIPGFGESGSKLLTVAAQPVVLKALARLFFEYHVGKGKGRRKDPESFQKLIESLKAGKLDFSHSNPLWRSLQLSPEEREKKFTGLGDYLPANRSLSTLGVFDPTLGDHGVMIFGSRHNDIYPVLADMIRWNLSLPSRKKDQAEEK
jgi:DNA-sulfur modification-associated